MAQKAPDDLVIFSGSVFSLLCIITRLHGILYFSHCIHRIVYRGHGTLNDLFSRDQFDDPDRRTYPDGKNYLPNREYRRICGMTLGTAKNSKSQKRAPGPTSFYNDRFWIYLRQYPHQYTDTDSHEADRSAHDHGSTHQYIYKIPLNYRDKNI